MNTKSGYDHKLVPRQNVKNALKNLKEIINQRRSFDNLSDYIPEQEKINHQIIRVLEKIEAYMEVEWKSSL